MSTFNTRDCEAGIPFMSSTIIAAITLGTTVAVGLSGGMIVLCVVGAFGVTYAVVSIISYLKHRRQNRRVSAS